MITGEPVVNGAYPSLKDRLLFLLPLFVFTLSLSMIYPGMRGVMDLGGFVATGGPYEIAHPAPDWVWIFPVFINLMVISMIFSAAVSGKVSGPNLMSLSWSALFLSLGWNFTEYGFGIGRPHGLLWGWVICSVLFLLMGGIPLAVILDKFVRDAREPENDRSGWGTSLTVQTLVIAGALYLGHLLFASLQ